MQGVGRAEVNPRRRRRGRGGGRGGGRDDGFGMVRKGALEEEEEEEEAGAGPSSGAARLPPLVVRVKRETLVACMTCPLCHKLFRDATTISECLHTFCRKCIFEKLTDEDMECCPVCKIDLGCVPIEKLRTDHNFEDVRAKIFPFKRRKVKAPDIAPSIFLPTRRKERSLSSLVVTTPRVATQNGLTGRRTKSVARKVSALRGLCTDVTVKNENKADDYPETSNSAEIFSKMSQNRRQNSSSVEPLDHRSSKDIESHANTSMDKAEMWKSLNCLVEAANRTKSPKFSAQSSVTESDQTVGPENELDTHKSHPHKGQIHYDKNKGDRTAAVLTKPQRMHGVGRKRTAASRELGISTQALLDAASIKHEEKIGAIWFSLISSPEKGQDVQLPQIPACYLRIKDGSLPVSFIHKYLAMKLDLASEAEVEITCRGQPVVPTLALRKLVDLWLQAGSSQKAQASIGNSAKDFVMVLTYARKLPPT